MLTIVFVDSYVWDPAGSGDHLYYCFYRMILAIIAGAVLILLIVAGWCAWRFMKKKRPKGADEKVGHSSFFSFCLFFSNDLSY
jgi:hypothetical protein